MTAHCRFTWSAADEGCSAWRAEGWPWHGCTRNAGHRGVCRCRCGAAWRNYKLGRDRRGRDRT